MIKTALLVIAAASSSTDGGGGCSFCGHYNGEGDRVYERGSELMVVCANGGIVANLTESSFEGTFEIQDESLGRALRGGTGEFAFEVQDRADGTAMTPELGGAAWTRVTLDKTALDHADVLCTDLEARAWWP